jgi:hypothetical protein
VRADLDEVADKDVKIDVSVGWKSQSNKAVEYGLSGHAGLTESTKFPGWLIQF